MKQIAKQKVKQFLAWAARQIIAKYKPKVIGITGSVGKTSTKEAVFAVVSKKYKARKPDKNFNNEFGLPLTIIGVDSPGSSAVGWFLVCLKALKLIYTTVPYPEVLVLEMGIDRPGDMDYLVGMARPDIGIVTTIGMSHYEFFSDLAGIEHEKGKLVEAVPEQGIVILNADNAPAVRQQKKTHAKVVTYGNVFNQAIVALTGSEEILQGKIGTRITVSRPRGSIQLSIPAIGATHVAAVLAAVAVADALDIEDSLIVRGVEEYRPAAGRLNIISGIKHTTLIDDTYNAAPDSMKEALQLLERIPAVHKMAVLGDMLELGALSDSAHEDVGNAVAALHLDHLITVGESGRIIADSAKAAGMVAERILSFDTADEARKTVQNILEPDSVVLIKGSQGVRMEKITKEIMAEPMRAKALLCRQYGEWIE